MRTATLLSCVLLAGCVDNQTFPDTHAAYTADAGGPLPCVPNLDGRIDSTELTPFVDIPVTYLVSPQGTTRPVNLAGAPDPSGKIAWDWSVDVAGDQEAIISASTLTGKWYASSFPTGQFVVPFDAGDTVEAVYTHDTSAFSLLGLASTQPSPPEGKTLVVYDQPIALYKFPITVGAAWTSSGNVTNGTLRGLPYAGKDTYDTKDDATGTMLLHDFTFQQAHRVRTTVTVAPVVGMTTSQRQVSFLFECFGEVARATSQPNEMNDNFTTAAEVRRLGTSPE